MTYREALEKRRSIRSVNKNANVGREEIIALLEDALTFVPSGYNMQSARLLLLMGAEHERFWDEAFETLMKDKDDAARKRTREKFDGFQNGIGTVLYFDDMDVLAQSQKNIPQYADTMEDWMMESQGMMQFAIWTGLVDLGLGVSIQHYNPVVDEMVARNWDIPANWTLRAQMPFGGPAEAPFARASKPAADRYKVFGNF